MLRGFRGPDADAPEELNLIKRGHHYGFPFQFSNWTKKPYAHTPDIPVGLKIDLPIPNYGPAEDGDLKKPLYSWRPHAAPTGIVFLGPDFPKPYRGGYFVSLFGNLLDVKQAGFEMLHLDLTKGKDGKYKMKSETFLAPMARPVDLHLAGKGKVFILEYARDVHHEGGFALNMPGRLLELSVNP